MTTLGGHLSNVFGWLNSAGKQKVPGTSSFARQPASVQQPGLQVGGEPKATPAVQQAPAPPSPNPPPPASPASGTSYGQPASKAPFAGPSAGGTPPGVGGGDQGSSRYDSMLKGFVEQQMAIPIRPSRSVGVQKPSVSHSESSPEYATIQGHPGIHMLGVGMQDPGYTIGGQPTSIVPLGHKSAEISAGGGGFQEGVGATGGDIGGALEAALKAEQFGATAGLRRAQQAQVEAETEATRSVTGNPIAMGAKLGVSPEMMDPVAQRHPELAGVAKDFDAPRLLEAIRSMRLDPSSPEAIQVGQYLMKRDLRDPRKLLSDTIGRGFFSNPEDVNYVRSLNQSPGG